MRLVTKGVQTEDDREGRRPGLCGLQREQQGDEEGQRKSWERKTRLKGKPRERGMPEGRNGVSRRKDWFSMSVKT